MTPSDREWQTLLDAMHEGACLVDDQGIVVRHNRAFARILCGGESCDGKALADIAPWIDRVGEADEDHEVGDRVVRARRTGAVLVVTDVTESLRTAEALRVSSETTRAIVEASPLAILALDVDMRVTMWNAAAERMFGFTEREVLGTRYPIVPLSARSEFEGFFRRVVSGEGFAGVESKRQRKDGSIVDVSVSTAPLRDASGQVVGAMALLMDLTEQKKLEEQFRQAQKMEAVGRLAGGVAHDFNNVLTVILNTCEFLLFDSPPGEERAGTAEVTGIKRAAERAGALTRQLLAFSRRQVLTPKVLDLNVLVRDMTAMLTRLIGEDVAVSLVLAPELGLVRADPGQLEQLVMNLAVNARDAMPRGGTLTIETREISIGVASRSPLPPGRYAELLVSDDGIGMEEETLRHVFEPFFTTKKPGEGTGLGLATAYGIARQSGGDITVTSAPGKGTTFRVLLPMGNFSVPEEPPEARRPPGTEGAREAVLLVEDDEPLRRIVRRVLETFGYAVHEAEGGPAALEICATDACIDVLLTDVVMPQMSGREVAERVRAIRPGVKVLYMSGYTDDAVLRHGLSTGASAPLLHKPFTPDELAAKLREVLGAAR
jgi:two-component system cell cycle sensor histidine kinase/response regulator CckA